jgi:hypothetical protein
MYAIVLIAILAVLLVFGIILWWRWPRKNPDLEVYFEGEEGEEKGEGEEGEEKGEGEEEVDVDLEDEEGEEKGEGEEEVDVDVDLEDEAIANEINRWKAEPNGDRQPSDESWRKLTLAERGLFDSIGNIGYWKEFVARNEFLAELYRLEASAVIYMVDYPFRSELLKFLKIKAHLCEALGTVSAAAYGTVDIVVDAINQAEVAAYTQWHTTNPTQSMTRSAQHKIARANAYIEALGELNLLPEYYDEKMKKPTLGAMPRPGPSELQHAFDAAQEPISDFIASNRAKVESSPDGAAISAMIADALQKNEINKNPARSLVMMALWGIYARIVRCN